jgi:hypothetical protein
MSGLEILSENVTRQQSLVHASDSRDFTLSLARSKKPNVQETNAIVAHDSDGGLEMSMLKRDDNVGAVVRRHLRRGIDQTDVLAFLPRTVKDANVSLLEPCDDHKWLRLVLTNKPRESYSFNDPSNVHLPRILKHRQSTVVEYTEPYLRSKQLT